MDVGPVPLRVSGPNFSVILLGTLVPIYVLWTITIVSSSTGMHE